MQLKANYIKNCITVFFLCIAFKGIAQRETDDINLYDIAIHTEINYAFRTVRNFRIHNLTHFYNSVLLNPRHFHKMHFF